MREASRFEDQQFGMRGRRKQVGLAVVADEPVYGKRQNLPHLSFAEIFGVRKQTSPWAIVWRCLRDHCV